MKTMNKYADKAQRLFELVEFRKQIEKEEKEIKELFKTEAGDEPFLKVGGYMIVISTKSRTSLDRKALAVELGDKLELFENVTEYKQVDIKAA
jgi:hypothetical protein